MSKITTIHAAGNYFVERESERNDWEPGAFGMMCEGVDPALVPAPDVYLVKHVAQGGFPEFLYATFDAAGAAIEDCNYRARSAAQRALAASAK